MFYDFVTPDCSEKMSPYEGDGDIEQERTEEVASVKSSGEGSGEGQGSS
jgi:hypothetical protein